jgi:hypothetical protein
VSNSQDITLDQTRHLTSIVIIYSQQRDVYHVSLGTRWNNKTSYVLEPLLPSLA